MFTIVGKILTSTRNPEHNKEAFDALNRIIKDNNGLKTWTFGIATRYKSLLEADGGTKTANYYRKVIFNDLIESSATTIALGERTQTNEIGPTIWWAFFVCQTSEMNLHQQGFKFWSREKLPFAML